MPNLDDILDVQDYSAATLRALIERLLAANSAEQLIYRECELDEVWRLLDLEIASVRATRGSATDLAQLQQVRAVIEQAHDLVGVSADPAAAARRLRELIP